jgi:prepilin-type N-terminal cleavage/methylation domain-containing protein
MVRAPMGRRLAGDGGMTLVEVLAGLFILGVVLTAMVGSSVGSLGANRASEQRVHAVQLANEAVEELHALAWERVGLRVGDTPGATFEGRPVVTVADNAAVPQYQRTVTRSGVTYQVRTIVVRVATAPNGAELRGLIVDVSWDAGQRSVRGETRRASP